MPKFRKKPVVVEAVLYTGENAEEVVAFAGDSTIDVENGVLRIKTLEGTMDASPGDWVIRGVKGELYPCKPDIFDQTYEPAE